MSSKNKFGFAPPETIPDKAPRERSVGPMGAAVREAAESLQGSTEAKIEQRRRNSDDAKAYRLAHEEGRVLVDLPLVQISTQDLPRDRLALEVVATSDEMEELKASIRARGQKEPIEVYPGAEGQFELKKGWRRFTALSQLFAETGDSDFATVVARVEGVPQERISRYVDMVEENVVREDLSFGEMAHVAIVAAQDKNVPEESAEVLVGRLYGALHKMKRSYIRSFVYLLEALEEDLPFPKEVARNLGVEVARALKAGQGGVASLRSELSRCSSGLEQTATLTAFLKGGEVKVINEPVHAREKFEFRAGGFRVVARKGEVRIVGQEDFTTVSREKLARAVKAFEAALAGE